MCARQKVLHPLDPIRLRSLTHSFSHTHTRARAHTHTHTHTHTLSLSLSLSQCVYAHSRRSSLLRLKHGVPQGSVLGPLLFSVYVNDLPLYLRALCELFADDTTIHTSNSDINVVHDTLQNSIQELVKWTELNHMSLHPGKTTWMLLTTRQKRQNLTVSLPAIHMHNQVIEETTTHKVLGVILDNNLSWSPPPYYIRMQSYFFQSLQLSKVKHFLNFHARKRFSTPTFRHALCLNP